MAQYLINGTTLTGIADAIRAKTGSSDAIKVSDMANQIEGITGGGGGSVEGVHYVTFMSQDGKKELYKRVVADGDDCADPVSRGYISAPTKESTAQYNYSFAGWATTANGAWNENALKAVTEDKTVYAAFASVVRYYTITYYDEDGTTVLKTESLPYGAMPSYTPTKDAYEFVGWTPTPTAVTLDASYTAGWVVKTVVGSGTFGSGFTWSLSGAGKLSISGNGVMPDYTYNSDKPSMPWVNYIDLVTSVVIGSGVTSVGAYMFFHHTKLTSVTIPTDVLTIGDGSFRGCDGLKSISIPNKVTTIGSVAFYRCSALESIVIPNSVTKMGTGVFNGCSALASVILSNNLTGIGNSVFYYCPSLETLTIPASVTKISSDVFAENTALSSVNFEDTDTWYVGSSEGATTIQVDVTDPATAATLLTSTYRSEYWTKK